MDKFDTLSIHKADKFTKAPKVQLVFSGIQNAGNFSLFAKLIWSIIKMFGIPIIPSMHLKVLSK